jgi:hypothetical protein
MKFVAHANALNEHRGGLTSFDTRSILENATTAPAPNRIERNFLGAHSDIGGSYGTGDLSDIALMWMIEQASDHGLTVDMDKVSEKGWDVVTAPLLHDSRTTFVLYWFDREVFYADGSSVYQKKKNDAGSMTYQDTLAFITDKPGDPESDRVQGYVDIVGYCKWLNDHAYFKDKNSCI